MSAAASRGTISGTRMKLLGFHRAVRGVRRTALQRFGRAAFYAYGARAELGISIMTRMFLRNTPLLGARWLRP
jgi:hypothetical protein